MATETKFKNRSEEKSNFSIASTSYSSTKDECLADDSSSLGYGSGHSCTYSDALEARIDDFYRNRTPTLKSRIDSDEAEFYDLDSVDNFSVLSYDYDDDTSMVSADDFSSCTNISNNNFADFDQVEPSELLRHAFSNKLKIRDQSEKFLDSRRSKNTIQNEIGLALRSIPEDDHIYEEVHYDTTDLNLEGLRPPPLPKRTYCTSRHRTKNRNSSCPALKINERGNQKLKN